jgi:hypothetical protein
MRHFRIRTVAGPSALLAAVLVLLATRGASRAPIGTWDIHGEGRVTACLDDNCVSRRTPDLAGLLLVNSDGTYTSPNLGESCVGDVSDEVGTWSLVRRRIRFEPTNLDEIVDSVAACFDGRSVDISGYRNKAKLKDAGQLLKGSMKLRGSVRVRGRRVAVSGIVSWRGMPAADTAAAQRAGAPAVGILPRVVEQLIEP